MNPKLYCLLKKKLGLFETRNTTLNGDGLMDSAENTVILLRIMIVCKTDHETDVTAALTFLRSAVRRVALSCNCKIKI